MTDREAFEAWCASMGFFPTQARFETWQAATDHERGSSQPERKPMDKEHQDEIIDAFEASPWSLRRNIRWVIEATERHHGIKETP